MFPPEYQVLRKDRNSKARGGGVSIAVRKHYDMTLLPDLETNCEILWAKVQILASKFLTLGCFYRPPDSKISTSEELAKSLDLMPKNSNQTIVLGGDFNLPGIDWDNGVVNPKAANKSQCELLSLYSKAKRTNKADLWAKYKLCKRQTQRAIRSARWSFLKNKLSESLEQKNSKPLWRYIKSKRQDGNGVSPLKENGQLHSDSRRKAEILNNQFCSFFTSEDTKDIPKLPGPPNTEMPKFKITVQGVTKLLEGLNGGKASGPDELPNLILKNAANEISPFLKIIFDQSLQTGKLPDDWVEANVAPVFKKRDRHSPANYMPISLTCVCAKLLEHIICKQIMSHFSENKILTPVQHGFRSNAKARFWLQLMNLFKILKARHKQMLLSWILVRPLMLSPTNASCTNLTTMEFGEQLLIGFKIFWPIEPRK